MPATRRRGNIPVARNLSAEACYGPGDLVDFAKDDYAGEARVRVVWDGGVEEEDSWGDVSRCNAMQLGGYRLNELRRGGWRSDVDGGVYGGYRAGYSVRDVW